MDDEKRTFGRTLQECFKYQADISAFSDFTVEVNGVSFQCHKVILNAYSEFFHALFKSQMKECQENRVDLQGVTKEAFSVIFDAIYKGIDGITEENIIDVWYAAVQLQITFLIIECEHFVKKSITLQNCPDFYIHAELLNSDELVDFIRSFICNKFEFGEKEIIFSQLPVVTICKILQDDDLKAGSEKCVVDVVLWLAEYYEKSSTVLTQQDLVKLLSAVRLFLVDTDCLRKLFECDIIMMCKAARDLIFKAINYRLSVELRHDSWPDAAVHRATSKMKHAMVFAFGNTVNVYLLNDGSIHEYATLPISQMANLVVFDNVLYMNDCNTLQMCSQNKDWDIVLETKSRGAFPTRRNILFSLGHYIYCFDALNGCIQRSEFAPGCSKKWHRYLNNISFIESVIKFSNCFLLFGTLNNIVNVLYCTLNMRSFKLLLNNPITGPLDGMVSFTLGENVYILQKNGNVWKIELHQHFRLDFQFVCQLWDFMWQLYGCIIYKKQLFIFGSKHCPHKPAGFLWPTSLPGVIGKVKVVQIHSNTTCLPIVIDLNRVWSDF